MSLILLCLAVTTARAGDKGSAILDRAAEYHGGLQSMSAVMEVRMLMPEGFPAMGGMEAERYSVALSRPSKIAVVPDGEFPGATFVQDGSRQYASHSMFRRYVLGDAVPLDRIFQSGQEAAMAVPGLEILLGLGLESGKPGSLRGAGKVQVVAEEAIDEINCVKLSLRGSGPAAEIWIATGERPWLVRYRSDPPPPPKMPDKPGSEPMMLQFEPGLDIRLRNWKANPDLTGAFKIEPPEGFSKEESLYPPMEDMDEFLSGMEGDHPSLGQPAPEARLEPLGGKPAELSELRGKIVVLDFWATWCVPCIVELPEVAKVSEEFAERGVFVYAVNRGETKKTVRKFLEEQKIDLPVILDHGDKISSSFGVEGMPHVVVIDREGTVRKVHVGAMVGSEPWLRDEVVSLLAE